MTSKEKKIQIYCGACKRRTFHKVIAMDRIASDPDHEDPWGENHYLCKCAGCDTRCYAVAEWSQDNYINELGIHNYQWRTYPSSRDERHSISDLNKLPFKVRVIYQEAIGAVNSQLSLLTAIGLRALIESICNEQKVTGKNLSLKIDGMATKGILSKSQADILHSHRFLGNAAAHEIESAGRDELLAALEIAESVLRTIYVLPKLAEKIKTGKNLKGAKL
jgi:Domain of unknown function (DUF4145)